MKTTRESVNALRIVAGNAQALGMREEQEDSFAFSNFSDEEFISHGGVLAVLADGMGGLAKGREASQIAVTTFLKCYKAKSTMETIPKAMSRSLEAANLAVHELSISMELSGRIGTTLVATVVHEGKLYWLSVGDSRIYHWRSGRLEQLTHDHVFADELEKQVARGYISREDADANPDRHALTSYLGLPLLRQVDHCDEPLKLVIGDRVLLCSDGLYGMLDDEQMAPLLAVSAPAATATLMDKVLEQQYEYQDNLTVLVIGMESSMGATVVARQARTRKKWWLVAAVLVAMFCFAFAGSIWYNNKNEEARTKVPKTSEIDLQMDLNQPPTSTAPSSLPAPPASKPTTAPNEQPRQKAPPAPTKTAPQKEQPSSTAPPTTSQPAQTAPTTNTEPAPQIPPTAPPGQTPPSTKVTPPGQAAPPPQKL